MLDKLSGPRMPTKADFQRNLDSIFRGAQQDVRKKVAAAQSSFAARGLASSGALIGAAVEIIDEIHKNSTSQAMLLINEFSRANSQLPMTAIIVETRGRFQNFASTLLGSVPLAGMPHHAVKFQNQYAAVFQQRLDGALRDIEIGFVEGRRLAVAHNVEGEDVLDHMLGDRVTLVKKDGGIEREEIPSLVMKGKIQIHDASLPIEIGDHLLRSLPSGLVEDYIVDDPVLHSGLGQKFFSVHVRRSNAPMVRQDAAIQNITNNFHGSNSRVNIGSTDNSTNIFNEIGIDKLQALFDQIKAALGGLPPTQQQEIASPLALLEGEVRSGNPSRSKVAAALQSIKTVAEGATGNLIATGIIGLINSLVS